MSAVTILPLDRNELQAMLESAIEKAVLSAASRSGEEWGASEVAACLGRSERTIYNMVKCGKLPPPVDRKWRKADVLKWRADRANSA